MAPISSQGLDFLNETHILLCMGLSNSYFKTRVWLKVNFQYEYILNSDLFLYQGKGTKPILLFTHIGGEEQEDINAKRNPVLSWIWT